MPHFVDNGDGTVTDTMTGLMWEQKTDTNRRGFPCDTTDVHCVTNVYTWSVVDGPADGTLFTTFLAGLNGGDYYSPGAGQIVSPGAGTCFANHCDWRIPTVAELATIVELSAAGCTNGNGAVCIDPGFGPTQAFAYWSSSSYAGNAKLFAWVVYFKWMSRGADYFGKALPNYYARGVRGHQ